MHSNIFFQFFILFSTGAALKPTSFNMVQKFSYILLDLFEFFRILESVNFFQIISFKRKVKKILKKLCFSTGIFI